MKTFAVMLEGSDSGKGYLVTIEVVALDEDQAVSFALQRAQDEGWDVLNTEEVSLVRPMEVCGPARVTCLYGRTFFEEP